MLSCKTILACVSALACVSMLAVFVLMSQFNISLCLCVYPDFLLKEQPDKRVLEVDVIDLSSRLVSTKENWITRGGGRGWAGWKTGRGFTGFFVMVFFLVGKTETF